MDLVNLKCPNCGGRIERPDNEYFANCPYCGTEVAFDEIKEEASLERYRDRIDELERSSDAVKKGRIEIRKWMKLRNITLAVMSFCNFAAFSLVGYDLESKSDTRTGIGVIFFLLTWACLFFALPILSYMYPLYNIISGKIDKGARWKVWLKLTAVAIGLLVLSAILAYIFISILHQIT